MTVPTPINWQLPFDREAISSLNPERLTKYFEDQNRELNTVFDNISESVNGITQIFKPSVGNGSTDIGSFDEQIGMLILQGDLAFITMAIKFGSGHGVTGNMQIGNLPYSSHLPATVTNNDKLDWNFTVMNLEAGDLFSGIGILPPDSKTIEAVYKYDGTQVSLTSTAYDMTITGYYLIGKA